ncbi:MAG: small multi-drug export protein [Candidatus Sumerlaeia bacterium]|nr:small multi-drug export protein [Candidatus Sumerlaeia bacterium]
MFDTIHDFLWRYPWLLFVALHLTLGRTASISQAIIFKLDLWIAAPFAFFWDCVQVPLWWWLYNAVSRRTLRTKAMTQWIERREQRAEHRRLWQRFGALGNGGVVLLAALPFWGCGMWTATLLAWSMGSRLSRAFWYLALGGLLGLMAMIALGLGVKSVVT